MIGQHRRAVVGCPVSLSKRTSRDITSQRDALAGQIAAELAAATFNGQHIDRSVAQSQISQANQLLQRMHELAAGS